MRHTRELVDMNWRQYGAMIQADPLRARRGFMRVLMWLMAMAFVVGCVGTSLVWMVLTF